MGREKIQMEANDFLLFYGLVVGELLKYFEENKIECKADSVWRAKNKEGEFYFLTFLYEKLPSKEIREALLDDDRKVKNPAYLYTLKNDIINGVKSVDVLKDRGNLYSKFIDYKDINNFIKFGSLKAKMEEQVTNLVLNFYNHMAAGRYKECWDILSPKFRSRDPWKNNFDKFEEGYTNTRGIKNIHVFNARKQTDSVVECLVYYEDGVQRHVIEEFESLSTMSIKNIRSFVETVETMQYKITNVGGVGFDNILIQKLFDPTVSEYIWYKCQLAPDVVNTLFPDKRHTWVKRIYAVSCILIDTQWFIDLIIQDKTYTTR